MFRGQTKLTRSERIDTGEVDRYNRPIYEHIEAPMWGDLVPLKSEEFASAAEQIVTRYRVLLPASFGAAGPPDPAINIKDPDSLTYQVIGGYEPHRLRGALHHYEAIVERVTG